MLLQMALFHSFLWLNNIPLYIGTTSPLSICLSMDIQVAIVNAINIGVIFLTHSSTVLVSYCCSNKLPQTQWFETYNTVLDVRNLEWVYCSKIKVSAGLWGLCVEQGFWRLQKRISFLVFSSFLTHDPFLHLPGQQHIIFKYLSFFLTLTFLPSSWKNPCQYMDRQIVQDGDPMSRSLT